MKRIVIIGLAAIAGLLVSCLEKIDLEVPRGTEQAIVIQGRLVKGNPSKALVTVTRLFEFTPEGRKIVNVRSVVLSDEAGNSVELEQISTGTYYGEFLPGDPALSIESGKSYKIDVATFDGKNYESALEPMLEVPSVRNIKVEPIQLEVVAQEGGEERELRDFLRFFIDTDLETGSSARKSSLRWEVLRTYQITDLPTAFNGEPKVCYITEVPDVSLVTTFEGESSGNSSLENFFIFDAPVDYRFAEGFYIQIIQESLSEGAFKYWNDVGEVLDRDGNMFESPAGKIKSNYTNKADPSDEAFGYFYTTVQDTARLFISPEMVGNPTVLCPPDLPPPPGGGCPLAICCDCLSEEGSTTVKPDFWE